MRNIRKIAFLITIILTIALLIIPCGTIYTSASDEAEVKVTAMTSQSVGQGNSGTCYVYIDSLENLSTLSISVHYDPEKVRVSNYDVYNSVSCDLYDKSVVESSINFSYIFNGNGEIGRKRLFYFYYTVLSDAEVGSTYFDIVVNDAYDFSLKSMSISGSRCSFNITEYETQESCSIYFSSRMSTSVGEEFEISYQFSTYQIASGSLLINYDPELFEVVSHVV